MRVRFVAAIFALVISLCGVRASAEVSAYVSAEVWGFDDTGFHGIAIADYRFDFDSGDELRLTLNTDTLTARYQLGFDHLEIGFYGRGEYVLAGLLQDYYVGGARNTELGFDASYVEVGVDAKYGVQHHWVHGRVAGRKWFFAANQTADFYRLPPDIIEGEAELGYTFWALEPDSSLTDAHRIVFDRLKGFAAGIRLVASYRDDASNWGLGVRNNPEHVIPRVRQWTKFGVEYAEGFRLQIAEEAGAGLDEDDITRARIGGLNPYVVPIAGVPWAGFLASRYASVRLSNHVEIFNGAEWVLLADGAMVEDVERNGADALDPVAGVATGLDWRTGGWQVDLLFGYSPDTGWQSVEPPLVSAYLGVGYSR